MKAHEQHPLPSLIVRDLNEAVASIASSRSQADTVRQTAREHTVDALQPLADRAARTATELAELIGLHRASIEALDRPADSPWVNAGRFHADYGHLQALVDRFKNASKILSSLQNVPREIIDIARLPEGARRGAIDGLTKAVDSWSECPTNLTERILPMLVSYAGKVAQREKERLNV